MVFAFRGFLFQAKKFVFPFLLLKEDDLVPISLLRRKEKKSFCRILCMRRIQQTELVTYDPEFERILKRVTRKRRVEFDVLGDQGEAVRTIRDYFEPVVPTTQMGIAETPINASNFELKLGLIQMAQDLCYTGRVMP
ncbi:uncharacterized protein LOC120092758 [Benincasa hispida]|uniref:uncharacterized protein LOC120092758 n=1 Tax=Benincasa hispida TaxID=102211 RepID=UPI0018FFDDDC|nr:uncharacterized protein LOC120092758 [Benincasa hispida]